MKLTFVNVGYGEAILLEWEESGHTFTALIDGGKVRRNASIRRVPPNVFPYGSI